MIPRVLEPEVMDSAEEALDYDTMDHSAVNRLFVDDLLAAAHRDLLSVLDVGTGTAQIPIELCRRTVSGRVTAIDLAGEMIRVAQRNVAAAGLEHRIAVRQHDAKRLPFEDGPFDVVMSNSILHHIPMPADCLAEMVRVTAVGGLLFVRDLLRPAEDCDVERLVTAYAADANPHQRAMFRASLHAALTLDEVRSLVQGQGRPGGAVRQTSDRHWTLTWKRPADGVSLSNG